MNSFYVDADLTETQEWLDAFYALVLNKGQERAGFIIKQILKAGLINNCNLSSFNTDYRNTISNQIEVSYPGSLEIERKILAAIRWNAIAMVLKANRIDGSLGGHLSTYASAAVLYEVGFNHFWHTDDLIFMQGHASPGIYARAFLEGRLSEEQVNNFRREIFTNGLPSYPHPWSMPNFWQFSTVSMGLGPIQAIYQSRFMRYLEARELIQSSKTRKVWCFCGDGEMDEPESLGAISLASREKLDNLIFVINCNLQRLDGPVRGNGKIIQELESIFLGAGWNVIKIIWDHQWEELLDEDVSGLLLQLMENTVDGTYQCLHAKGGHYLRENFFGTDLKLKKLVNNLSDEELSKLEFGGHDINKVYQAYRRAVEYKGKPTVILAKTVKGYGLGAAGEGLNIAHSVKKLNLTHLQTFRDRFNLPLTDQQLENLNYYKFDAGSKEQDYLIAKRKQLGGSLPQRRKVASHNLEINDGLLNEYITSNPVRVISTTMAFIRILNTLCKDQKIGKYIVPIIADEARTFGMEGFFRQFSIYAPFGQAYKPVDSEQVMFYREDERGQILQEGLTEAGAFSSWLAAATAYSNYNCITVPFYIYYSMFGFQRIGDLIWAAADMRARGFLIGATSGRTTLAGEGLQHGDGHSHLLAGTVPNCLSYDPTFSYELACIIEEGLNNILNIQRDVFYYITIMNENYSQLSIPNHDNILKIKEGILKGLYLFQEDQQYELKVQLIGSGAILNEIIAAKEILNTKYKISANIWSATSFNLLARDARIIRERKLFGEHSVHEHESIETAFPVSEQSHVEFCLSNQTGPIIAATDYIKQYADQIREFIPNNNKYIVLGTDGFSYSDTRENLRKFFKVNAYYIVVAALQALIEEGKLSSDVLLNQKNTNGINQL